MTSCIKLKPQDWNLNIFMPDPSDSLGWVTGDSVREESIQEVSEGNKDSVRNWARSHLCDNLIKSRASVCLCPEYLGDVKSGGHGLVCLAEEHPG